MPKDTGVEFVLLLDLWDTDLTKEGAPESYQDPNFNVSASVGAHTGRTLPEKYHHLLEVARESEHESHVRLSQIDRFCDRLAIRLREAIVKLMAKREVVAEIARAEEAAEKAAYEAQITQDPALAGTNEEQS